jgi:hypothetical protein
MTVGRIPVIEGGIQPTIFDAKADLLTATANDTPARLAVGANNTYLVADSTASTGLKYVGFRGCYLYGGGGVSMTNNAQTRVTFASETIDTDGFHSTSTDTSRITIPSGLAGKYLVTAKIGFNTDVNGFRLAYIYKNGSLYSDSFGGTSITSSSGYTTPSTTMILDLAVSDYIEVYGFQNSGSTLLTRGEETAFMATYLGA